MKAFVIMPFKTDFNDVYYFIKEAVKNSVPGEKIECLRLDEKKAAGKITDDLIDSIETSTFCIADLTGNSPNVMWEVGYAIASKKPTIFICQDLSSIPFDLKDMRIIEYEDGNLSVSLTESLAMLPAASVSGYYFANEKSLFFGFGGLLITGPLREPHIPSNHMSIFGRNIKTNYWNLEIHAVLKKPIKKLRTD